MITCIEDPVVIEKILAHLGKKNTPKEAVLLSVRAGTVSVRLGRSRPHRLDPICCHPNKRGRVSTSQPAHIVHNGLEVGRNLSSAGHRRRGLGGASRPEEPQTPAYTHCSPGKESLSFSITYYT